VIQGPLEQAADFATLRRDRISTGSRHWRIFLRTTKNWKPVFLPILNELEVILDKVPLPRNAQQGCRYYFWGGVSKRRTAVRVAEECLTAVFKMSGVPKAHAHRFRHTLATELPGAGASFEEVANVLGNTPEIVRKHYAKRSVARQARITDLLERVHPNTERTILDENNPK
jgi:integrase